MHNIKGRDQASLNSLLKTVFSELLRQALKACQSGRTMIRQYQSIGGIDKPGAQSNTEQANPRRLSYVFAGL